MCLFKPRVDSNSTKLKSLLKWPVGPIDDSRAATIGSSRQLALSTCTKSVVINIWLTIQQRQLTDVLKVLSDSLFAIDSTRVLRRLEIWHGLGGGVLRWFETYLVDRRQYLPEGSLTSSPFTIFCGVPERSVLDDPVLITFRVSRTDNVKCIVITRVCVCLSTTACPHYCMDPDVTWRNGRGCPLVVDAGRICNRCMGCVATATQREREMSASACTRSMPGYMQQNWCCWSILPCVRCGCG